MLTLKKTECAECKPSIWARLAKPITVGASAGSAILSTALVASADEVTQPWQPIVTEISSTVSVSTVVGVLASCVGACITLVFMWWGARKVVKMLMSAWKRGKLRI